MFLLIRAAATCEVRFTCVGPHTLFDERLTTRSSLFPNTEGYAPLHVSRLQT